MIDASKLVVGDQIVVRIRADKGSSLGQVESTPANHIGDREPAAQVVANSASGAWHRARGAGTGSFYRGLTPIDRKEAKI